MHVDKCPIKMKLYVSLLVSFNLFLISCTRKLPHVVPDQRMEQIYKAVKTPYKYGLVLVSDSNAYKIDCPTLFRINNKWIMTYIAFDGRGYETWLAESDNLTHWIRKGKILEFSDSTEWDQNQKAGYPSLIEYEWEGDYSINTYDHKYWMSYFGGNSTGYEKGLLSIGLAFTDQDPSIAREWNRMDHPVLKSTDANAQWYDNSTLYKSCIIEDKEKLTGFPFVMFYNARGDSIKPERGAERISMALSQDMIHWKRYENNPIINHHTGICGDAVIQKIDDLYVMFYFGAFWPDQDAAAFNRFACSYDLIHWTDWEGPNLIEASEQYDALFAHKSYVIKYREVVYHFYNAVDRSGNRGIALATSKDLGKSTLKFSTHEESEIK